MCQIDALFGPIDSNHSALHPLRAKTMVIKEIGQFASKICEKNESIECAWILAVECAK